MTNLEKFKRKINSENLCDLLMCAECPVGNDRNYKKPCTERLKEWCKREVKK